MGQYSKFTRFSKKRYKKDLNEKNTFYKHYITISNKYGRYYRQLHRKNGPAEVFEDRGQYWFWKNKGHRIDGPFTNNTNHWKDSNRWHYLDKRMSEEPYWNY